MSYLPGREFLWGGERIYSQILNKITEFCSSLKNLIWEFTGDTKKKKKFLQTERGEKINRNIDCPAIKCRVIS